MPPERLSAAGLNGSATVQGYDMGMSTPVEFPAEISDFYDLGGQDVL